MELKYDCPIDSIRKKGKLNLGENGSCKEIAFV